MFGLDPITLTYMYRYIHTQIIVHAIHLDALSFLVMLSLCSRDYYVMSCPFPIHTLMVCSALFSFFMIGKSCTLLCDQ